MIVYRTLNSIAGEPWINGCASSAKGLKTTFRVAFRPARVGLAKRILVANWHGCLTAGQN